MIALLGIPFVFLGSILLYRLLRHWIARRDAGSAATFCAFAGCCLLFMAVFLPLEFPRAWRFFAALVLTLSPRLALRTRKNPVEPCPVGQRKDESWGDLFEKGDPTL